MRADEAVCIGSGPRKDYLNIDKIILAAQQTGAQAIHPGYGFLAENPDFPEACTSAGLVFIGPPPEVIRNLGSKVIARKIAQATGVRVIPATGMLAPGAPGEEAALAFAAAHGYPIMIKAVSGGGGRGIRQVGDRDSLLTGLKRSRSEALMSFGDDNIYLEKCVQPAPARGGPDPGRFLWQRGAPGDQELLHSTPPPETHRDRPGRSGPGFDRRDLRRGGAGRPGRRVSQRRHGGIPGGARRHLLLPGSQYPPAGGAYGHRGVDRHRHRPGAALDRHGRTHQLFPGAGRTSAASPSSSGSMPKTPKTTFWPAPG